MAKMTVIAAAALAWTGGACAQSEPDGANATALVESALARGYGAACSLAYEPVASRGVYPCLDIGPYRFVKEYEGTKAFVLVDKAQPYQVAELNDGRIHFLVRGPWMADMAARVEAWWSDEIDGARVARENDEKENRRHDEAAKSVEKFTSKGEAKPDAPQDAER
jgi:hypothetical protein